MSKNFELLQHLESKGSTASQSVDEARFSRSLSPTNEETNVRWARAEALRLVQQIFLLQSHEPPHVVVFAAVDHGNGCSQVCASVAEILARTARKPVCLVEANFHSPSLAGMFGTKNHFGLTESLLNEGAIDTFTSPVGQENLRLLSSGSLASDSSDLLTSVRLRERLSELRNEFEFVIIDAPPMTSYSDAVVLGQLSDGLVLVLEANATRREAALVATDTLRSANVPILAAVLNKRTLPIPANIYNKL